MGQLDGVAKASASFKKKSATIVMKDGMKLRGWQIAVALEEEDFGMSSFTARDRKVSKLKRVHSKLKKAADAFKKGQYGKALKAAEKVLGGDPDEKLLADAKRVVDRVETVAKELNLLADRAKEAKRYGEAIDLLQKVVAGFKGVDQAKKASERITKMKKDKEIKAELKATAAFEKTCASLKKIKSPLSQVKALLKFAAKNKGTAAAEEAEKYAQALK